MKISASSFETAHDDCMRKWWWKEVRDMPEGKEIKGAAFGSALHGVCERFLLADDRGNGPELYPAGWNDGLDAAESALVRLLVQAAIDKGHLVRRAGRKVEEWMNTPILVDDDVVQLTGKLDVMDPTGFEDHKSTSARKWAKDEEGLASDSAMLFYAVEWCKRNADAIQVRMRYNYFLKDPSKPETWPVEVLVNREVVEHFKRKELLPTVRAMVAVANQNLTDEQWEQVEGPKSQDVCRKFAGCPYATICGRVEQPAQFRARIARILANKPQPPMGIFNKTNTAASPAPATTITPDAVVVPTPPPAPPVVSKPAGSIPSSAAPAPRTSIFARRNTIPPASPPTTPGPAAQAPVAEATPAVTAPAPSPAPVTAGQAPVTLVQLKKPEAAQPVVGAPPWAHPGCKACKGTGMHPKEKKPCKGCRTTKMLLKQPTDEAFEISYSTDGSLVWKAKDGTLGVVEAIAPVTAPVAQPAVPTIEQPIEKKTTKPRPKKAPEVAADVQLPSNPGVEMPTGAAEPYGPTMVKIEEKALQEMAAIAKLPLGLLCGSSPEKIPAYYKAASMADVFAEAAKLVGEASGKDFWSLNAFERRDALAKMAPDLAARLHGYFIVAPRSGPDQDALVQALKPFAGFVILGTS